MKHLLCRLFGHIEPGYTYFERTQSGYKRLCFVCERCSDIVHIQDAA